MKNDIINKLKEVMSVSSREKEVRELLKELASANGNEVIFDNLGSTFIHIPSKQSNAKKLMISVPMDEKGYLIRKINDDGSLRIVQVGEQNGQYLLGRKMRIETRDGSHVIGYTVCNRKSDAISDDSFDIFVGAKSKEEVQKLGIHIGDAVVIEEDLVVNSNYVIGRSLDVKIGYDIIQQLLVDLQKKDLSVDVYLGGVVQEKVGYRGSVSCATTIRPDINISFSLENTNDFALGSGPFIKSFDKTTISNYEMYNDLLDDKLTHAYISDKGTSASFIHKSLTGIPSVVVGIHAENLGLPIEICDMQDIDKLCTVLFNFISNLTPNDINRYLGERK